MRVGLTYALVALALTGIGVAAYALLQPNPSGDYLTGMAQLFIAMLGAGAALFAAIVAALLKFTRIKTRWVITGAVGCVGLAYAVLEFL